MTDKNDKNRDQDLETRGVEDQAPEHQDLVDLVAKVREEYNDPPPTPREAMWTQIVAHVGTAQDPPSAPGEPSQQSGGPRTSRFGGWGTTPWWTAAAAGLALLVVGYGLGRGTGSIEDPVGTTVAQSDPVEHTTPIESGDPETRGAIAGQREGPFRMAAVQHLAQTGSLLARVGASEGSGRIAPELGQIAARLLTDTRLMLDNRSDLDPEMRSLLEDLELVLIQVVHAGRSSDAPDSSRDRLEVQELTQGLEDNEVLPRIRRMLPVVRGA